MENLLKKLAGNSILIFSLIFVVSVAFYLLKNGFSDLWGDETYTLSMLDGTFSDFYAKFKNDLHPPLYYLGLRLYTGLFGLSTTTLRSFSVVGVLATLLLGYFAGQRVFGKQGALFMSDAFICTNAGSLFASGQNVQLGCIFSYRGFYIFLSFHEDGVYPRFDTSSYFHFGSNVYSLLQHDRCIHGERVCFFSPCIYKKQKMALSPDLITDSCHTVTPVAFYVYCSGKKSSECFLGS